MAGASRIADGINDRPIYDFPPPEDFFAEGVPGGAVFDVTDFGAIADPGINNQPMIQAAIDAAAKAGGGIVFIPPGTYGIASHPDGYGAIHLHSNVFLKGAGMGETTLRLVDGHEGDVTGLVRSPWNEGVTNYGLADLTLDGNQDNTTGQVDGFFTGPQPGSTLADEDVYAVRVEITEVSRYGFDPHELTQRLTIIDSVAHNNGVDGFVLDRIVEADISGNASFDNGRHGFNVVTTSEDIVFEDNIAHDNGGAGFVVQRGSENIDSPSVIKISGGESYNNGREGILIQFSDDVIVENMDIHHNGHQGVRLYGSSDSTVRNNKIHDNSQDKHGGYSEVEVEGYFPGDGGREYEAASNDVSNNTISASGDVRASYGVEVIKADLSTSSLVGNNVSGMVRGQARGEAADGWHKIPGQYDLIVGQEDGSTVTGDGRDNFLTYTDPKTAGHLKGKGGDDLLHGGYDADDRLEGGSGNDILRGDAEAETTYRGGDDELFGGSGDDQLLGGSGNDLLSGGTGDDVIYDGAGHDHAKGGKGNDTFVVDWGWDPDLPHESDGFDFFNGNSGIDTLDFSADASLRPQAVSINASTKAATGSLGDEVRFSSIEIFNGSAAADTFRGSDEAETFNGGYGDDVIRSAGGADTLTGGAGDDTFVYVRRDVVDANGDNRGVDLIGDYNIGDVIDVSEIAKGNAEAARVTQDGDDAIVTVLVGDRFEDVARLGDTDADTVTLDFGGEILS